MNFHKVKCTLRFQRIRMMVKDSAIKKPQYLNCGFFVFVLDTDYTDSSYFQIPEIFKTVKPGCLSP